MLAAIVCFCRPTWRNPRRSCCSPYDDPIGVTAAFNMNLLARINRELGGEFDLGSFRHQVRGNWATIAKELPDGIYTARAERPTPPATWPEASRTFTVARAPKPPPPDTTPPATPSTPDLHPSSDTGSSQSDDLTNDTTPRFTGNTERGATVTILSDGVAVGTDVANGSGRYDVTVSVLTPGGHTIRDGDGRRLEHVSAQRVAVDHHRHDPAGAAEHA